jgi:glucose-1-phosphate thymidylyltransferase
MKAIILAAGYATRLYPLTENYPKPLLRIVNKPILDYLVDDLLTISDINEIILVTNNKFYDHFMSWSVSRALSIPIHIINDGSNANHERLGAIADLELALNGMKQEEDIFVLAGDNICDFSLKQLVDFYHTHHKSSIFVHELKDVDSLRKTGVAQLDGLKLVSFEEKPENPMGTHAVPPFYIYTKDTLEYIHEYMKLGLPKDAPGSLLTWLSKIVEVYACPMIGHRYDIGDIESYQDTNIKFFKLLHIVDKS